MDQWSFHKYCMGMWTKAPPCSRQTLDACALLRLYIFYPSRSAQFDKGKIYWLNCTELYSGFPRGSKLISNILFRISISKTPLHRVPKCYGESKRVRNHQRLHFSDHRAICTLRNQWLRYPFRTSNKNHNIQRLTVKLILDFKHQICADWLAFSSRIWFHTKWFSNIKWCSTAGKHQNMESHSDTRAGKLLGHLFLTCKSDSYYGLIS